MVVFVDFQHNKRSISNIFHFRSRSKEICDLKQKDVPKCDKRATIIFKEAYSPAGEKPSNCQDVVDSEEASEFTADMTMAASSVVLSNNTIEKVAKAKATIENYYTNLINQHRERRERYE